MCVWHVCTWRWDVAPRHKKQKNKNQFPKLLSFYLQRPTHPAMSRQFTGQNERTDGSARSQVYKNRASASAIKCVRQRLPFRSGSLKFRGIADNQEVRPLSQLSGALGCILLTSLISISSQHMQSAPAMNQNLEGSLFSKLRREPFDKAVRDARQRGLGCVVFLDWHYTFMV